MFAPNTVSPSQVDPVPASTGPEARRRDPRLRPGLPQVMLVFPPSHACPPDVLKGIAHYHRASRPWAVTIADERVGIGALLEMLTRRPWDGVICGGSTARLLPICRESHLPVVDLTDAPPQPGAVKVRTDDTAVGRAGAAYLHERGFSHLAFCGYAGVRWSAERRHGFETERARRRCAGDTLESGHPEEDSVFWTAEAMSRLGGWLRGLPAGTAVMTADDRRAQQLLHVAQRLERRVPEDLAILGANDDVLICELSAPSISSVALDSFEVGRQAAATLDRLIAGAPVTDLHFVPAGVIARGSTEPCDAMDPHVAAAMAFIRDREGCVAMPELLAAVSISRRNLESRMRRCVGRSPQEEIRRVRLARIRELLAGTTAPLKEIAAQTGFEHVEYLSVFFKRLTGETPGAYRQRTLRVLERA